MATTEFPVNDALAVKLWAKKLFQEALKQTYASKFMGSGADSVIQIKGETSKGAGDQITIGLRMQLSGAGVQGDGTLEGNEESLTTYSDAVVINQLRHAVRSAGKMSEQRVPFSVREEARQGLTDWWADRIDTWFFNQICGNTAVTDTRFTGNNPVVGPDADHRVFSTGTDDQTVNGSSSSVFNLAMIDRCVERAKVLSPMIRPIKINGEDKYVMFLHPFQVYDLRTATSTGQWLDIQKAAMAGSRASESPIFKGALGEYNGVILHESTRVAQGIHSSTGAVQTSTRRAVFCGAQSAVVAYGKDSSGGEMTWVEELFDYGNQLGVSAGMIGGLKKARFNSRDFSTITATTFAVQH